MSIAPPKLNNIFKWPGFRSWATSFVVAIGVGILFYYGYCFGFWGRGSLLLQHLFQCNCPALSEAWRYSKEVDVIVSACRQAWVELSPSGHFLSVREKDADPYVVDLQNNNKLSLALPQKAGFYFLTDTLLFVSFSYNENYVVDRVENTWYPLPRFMYVYPAAYIHGSADPTILANALAQSKYVFFREYDDTIIALDSDFPASGEKNLLINRFDIPGEALDRMEKFLKQNDIGYIPVDSALPQESLSSYGRFIARKDGIYLAKTNQKIVAGARYLAVGGWVNDRRVLYFANNKPCLWDFWIPMIDDGPSCSIYVSQPAIILNVPEEYLSAKSTP